MVRYWERHVSKTGLACPLVRARSLQVLQLLRKEPPALKGNERGLTKGEVHMSDEDLEVLITLDDPWYGPDEDTFHHLQPDTDWPGQPSRW